jgi:hypothetical protein
VDDVISPASRRAMAMPPLDLRFTRSSPFTPVLSEALGMLNSQAKEPEEGGTYVRMRSFRVRRYKNVLDSTEVSVEDDVTTLVGMNESGKSTMLDALYRLNPVYVDKFVELDDYPRWRRSRDSRNENLASVTPIEATFRLDQDDHDALREALGEGVCTPETVTFGRRYDDSLWIGVSVDVERFLQNAVNGHPHADDLLAAHDTVSSLRAALASQPAAPAPAATDDDSDLNEDREEDLSVPNTAALARITALLGGSDDLNAVARKVVHGRLPKFFLFTDYQRLEGRVDVSTLKVQTAEHPGASPEQTARALLKLANTDVNAMTDSNFEASTAELESVSNELSREMKEYWSTNPDLRIKIATEPVIVNTPYGQTSVVGHLNFRVEDRKHEFTNNFSRRSVSSRTAATT